MKQLKAMGEAIPLKRRFEPALNNSASQPREKMKLGYRLGSIFHLESTFGGLEIVASTVVGIALGFFLLVTDRVAPHSVSLVLLATLALTLALLVGNLRKLLLILIVVDIPLGLDIALANRLNHNGGPSGLMISLMTLALVTGYIVWVAERPATGKPNIFIPKDVTIPALIFLFTMLVSALQAPEVWFSITQLFLEAQFLLMYLYLIHHIKTWANVRLIFTVLAISLSLESIVILLQYFTNFEFLYFGIRTGTLSSNVSARFAGTLGHPNVAATFLSASLVITFAGFLTNDRLINKNLALLAFLLGTMALITTQSRSSLIIFTALILILALQALRKRIGVRAVWIILIITLVIGVQFSEQIIDRFTTDDRGSAQSRVWQTKLGFNILSDHLLTGIGLNNLWEVTPDYLPSEMVGNINVIHDKYLTVWVETGLLGLLSFAWLLLAACRRALHVLIGAKNRHIFIANAGLLAALLAEMVHMSVATFNERPRLQLMWLILALIVVTSEIAKTTDVLEDPFCQLAK